MKKTASIFLTVLIIISLMSTAARASTQTTIVVESVSGEIGDIVSVDISIENNPGLIAMRMYVNYDSTVLELTEAVDSNIFGTGHSFFGKDITADPYTLMWEDALASDNYTQDGNLATLYFKVLSAPKTGETEIKVEIDKGSTINVDLDEVAFDVENGSVFVKGATVAESEVYADDMSVNVGETFEVPVYIKNNPGMIAMKMSVSYDSEKLKLIGARNGVVFGSSTAYFGKDLTANPYTLLWEDALTEENYDEDGILFTLIFELNEAVGACETEIEFLIDKGSTFDIDINEVDLKAKNCLVTVGKSQDSEESTPSIEIEEISCKSGDIVEVPIVIKNNPGLIATKLLVSYDADILTLLSADNGEIFGENNAYFGKQITAVPYVLLWEDALSEQNYEGNGILAILTFKVKEGVQASETEIVLEYDRGSTFDVDLNEVAFNTTNGILKIKPAPLESGIYVYEKPHKTVYEIGETLDITGLLLKFVHEDGSFEIIESGIEYDEKVFEESGKYTVVVGYAGYTVSFTVIVRSTEKRLNIINYDGDFDKKINWWKRYSTATMALDYNLYNCKEAARFEWKSSNPRVKIDQNGNITNVGCFARSSRITLTAFDSDGNIVMQTSVRVRFYKFNWQTKYLRTQDITSDSFLMAMQGVQNENTQESETVASFFSILLFLFCNI